MFFAAKPKGVFIEFTEHSRRVVRANMSAGAILVEAFAECEESDTEGWQQILDHFLPKKATHGFLQAGCGIFPGKRLLRRATIEPKRLKEPGYLSEFSASQFRIDPATYTLAVLNASDGMDYDHAKALVKDVLLVGIPTEVVHHTQDWIVSENVYPERLELGSLARLGALVDYLKFSEIKSPVAVVELEMEVSHSFIVSSEGVEASRLLPHGLRSMIPVVQKELGLKDEDSAKKLFFSNTFDFTGMGPALIKRLLHELQSSIGFFEVQTGQSISHVMCPNLGPKLGWLEEVVAGQLGVMSLPISPKPWLESRGISFSPDLSGMELTREWFGVLSLLARYDATETAEKK